MHTRRLISLFLIAWSLTLGARAQVTLPPPAETPPPATTPLNKIVSNVYGAHLFQGNFSTQSFTGFNPDYQISVGDKINLTVWGAVKIDSEIAVDARGNIFIPEVGPVSVAGVRNSELNKVVKQKLSTVYTKSVESYVNLRSTQSVKVFVAGYVKKPGLYEGFSADSVLFFLDKAGGIDPLRGSFLDIKILRDNQVIQTCSLYDFMLNGRMSLRQFSDGDTVLVGAIKNTFTVAGAVNNTSQFEFDGATLPLADVIKLAQPLPTATHLSIARSSNGESQALTYPINTEDPVVIAPQDVVTFTQNLNSSSIIVNITGEHIGPRQIVLPYGAKLVDAIQLIKPSTRANLPALQLFRPSVAAHQKELLLNALDNLERSVLTARSASLEEAKIRQQEGMLIQNFVERAKNVVPKGQVILSSDSAPDDTYLENNDTIFIPAMTNLINIHGEVKFPSTVTWDKHMSVSDYIKKTGGFGLNADEDNIFLVKADGNVVNLGEIMRGTRIKPEPGDEILVPSKPDHKYLQFAKEITTILYQMAVSARVLTSIK